MWCCHYIIACVITLSLNEKDYVRCCHHIIVCVVALSLNEKDYVWCCHYVVTLSLNEKDYMRFCHYIIASVVSLFALCASCVAGYVSSVMASVTVCYVSQCDGQCASVSVTH